MNVQGLALYIQIGVYLKITMIYEVVFDVETKKWFDDIEDKDPGSLGVSVLSLYERELDVAALQPYAPSNFARLPHKDHWNTARKVGLDFSYQDSGQVSLF